MHFEVYRKLTQRADHTNSVTPPEQYPCFELVFNYNWDDSGYKTWFALWYVPAPDEFVLLGELKILCEDNPDTFEAIPKSFDTRLPDEFCSLGLDLYYYKKIKSVFEDDMATAWELMSILRDCAVNVDIRDRFKITEGYRDSLTRELVSERVLKEARMVLEGRGDEDAFSYRYRFSVPYNEHSEAFWNVRMLDDAESYRRNYGIVGENGVGKTSLLRSFVRDLQMPRNESFERRPLFNCVTVICSSDSDGYEKIENGVIPCSLFSLEQTPENKKRIVEKAAKISASREMLNKHSLITSYRTCLMSFIGDNISEIFVRHPDEDDEKGSKIVVDGERLWEIMGRLSSGQLHMLAMATFLIADMHAATLVVIDEPEVHLHPSVIVKFMSFLAWILKQYGSYSVIATHSPLVVREMVSGNVFQMMRMKGDIPQIGVVSYDTFGENISRLYRNIFGYDEEGSLFSEVVNRLAARGATAEDIERAIYSNSAVNLNARMRIHDILARRAGGGRDA